ncbi:MAG: PaaI family thioesterase [Nitrososphaerota archaeon]|nr:PaaI family thioesterase [Nitrososphaerota archaeon]
MSNFGELAGIHDIQFEDDTSVIRLRLEDKHRNHMGVAHGGLMATLADMAMGAAAHRHAQRPLVTVEMKLSYMRPGFGGSLVAKGRMLKKGEHLLFASCTIYDDKGQEALAALGTYMMVEELKG